MGEDQREEEFRQVIEEQKLILEEERKILEWEKSKFIERAMRESDRNTYDSGLGSRSDTAQVKYYLPCTLLKEPKVKHIGL